jgi:hypothetical protein
MCRQRAWPVKRGMDVAIAVIFVCRAHPNEWERFGRGCHGYFFRRCAGVRVGNLQARRGCACVWAHGQCGGAQGMWEQVGENSPLWLMLDTRGLSSSKTC